MRPTTGQLFAPVARGQHLSLQASKTGNPGGRPGRSVRFRRRRARCRDRPSPATRLRDRRTGAKSTSEPADGRRGLTAVGAAAQPYRSFSWYCVPALCLPRRKRGPPAGVPAGPPSALSRSGMTGRTARRLKRLTCGNDAAALPGLTCPPLRPARFGRLPEVPIWPGAREFHPVGEHSFIPRALDATNK